MQSNQVYQIPPIEELFSPVPFAQEPPKDLGYNNSYSEANTPAFTTDIPAPYNLHGLEKQRYTTSPRVPKYSRKWLRASWNNAVEVGRWPRVIYSLIGLILLAAWIVVMLKFANEEVKYESTNMAGTVARGDYPRFPYEIAVKGTLRRFDPIARELTVSWSLLYIDTDNVTLSDLGTNENNTVHWNIYRDVRAVPETRNSTVFNMTGIYRIDNITEVPIAVLGARPYDSVTTDIDFTQAVVGNAWSEPLFGFPFDRWVGSIVFAATDRDYAEAVGLNNTWIVPLSYTLLSDSTFNWRITSTSKNTCLDLDPNAGCELHVDFTGRRPGLVIFAAMVALVVNWTTTLGIYLLTVEAIVLRRFYILKETDILGVCLTALFALPSVRAILPGAPDFGAIS